MLLLKLADWLKKYNFIQEAQDVEDLSTEEPKEYAESWHEEAVQEFGGAPISEDDYLEENFDSNNVGFLESQALKQNNFHPIETAQGGTYLNSGYFGSVFRGVYQGRPAVAKLILEKSGLNLDEMKFIKGLGKEVDRWNKVKEFRDHLPDVVRKHLPEVYHTNTGLIQSENGRSFEYEIIVMEELRNLPKQAKMIIDAYGKEYNENLNKLLKDEDFIYKMAELITKNIKSIPELQEISELQSLDPVDIFSIIYDIGMIVYNSNMVIINAIAEFLEKKYQLLPKQTVFIRQSVNKSIFKTFSGERFYRNKSEHDKNYNPAWEFTPETQSLLNALKVLSRDFNLHWADMKSNNLMMGNDGTIKIIDLGLYGMS